PARGRVSVDFEAEGLLEGLEGDEREARIDLLEQLTDAGVPLEDLKKAAAEDRLALLPVEQVLSGDAKHTRAEVAEKSGLPQDFLVKQWQALGLPVPSGDEVYFSDEDVEAAKLLRNLRDAGLDDEGIREVARVIG